MKWKWGSRSESSRKAQQRSAHRFSSHKYSPHHRRKFHQVPSTWDGRMNPYRQILDRDVLVQRFLVVGIANDVLLHRPRMHHGLRQGPQRGEDSRCVGDERHMHGLRVVVHRQIRHRLEEGDQLPSSSKQHPSTTWKPCACRCPSYLECSTSAGVLPFPCFSCSTGRFSTPACRCCSLPTPLEGSRGRPSRQQSPANGCPKSGPLCLPHGGS